ncbi:MAG: hypothetical protein ACR2N2_01685 [Acidimicrobiia bacterium]
MERAPQIYSPRRAWRIAGVAFVSWWLLAIVVGLVASVNPIDIAFTVGKVPAEGNDQVVWWVLVAGMFAIAVGGYWILWPIGTRTYGRPLHRWWCVGFGSVWGVSEALLYVTIWSVIRSLTDVDWLVVAISFIAIAAFTGTWHEFFWDRYVSPIHNIPEWNLRKVLLIHTPNLIVSLTFLTLYESGLLFVAAQVIALVGSTLFMRFPSPFDPDTNIDGSPLAATAS